MDDPKYGNLYTAVRSAPRLTWNGLLRGHVFLLPLLAAVWFLSGPTATLLIYALIVGLGLLVVTMWRPAVAFEEMRAAKSSESRPPRGPA